MRVNIPFAEHVKGNLIAGFTIGVLLAFPLIVPAIGGIDTWKYMLAAAGLWLFVRAGMGRPSS
jgi:hypothetical protein